TQSTRGAGRPPPRAPSRKVKLYVEGGTYSGRGPAPIKLRLFFQIWATCSGAGLEMMGGQLGANLSNDAVNSGRGDDDCFRGGASVTA
ncbi:MAG TPA: hypothetical protein VIK45_21495, partial [Candidatus Dormibacteraeota bacterium]